MNFVSFKIELSLSMVVFFFFFFSALPLRVGESAPSHCLSPLPFLPSPPVPLPFKVATLDEQYQNNAAPKGLSSGLKAGQVPRQSFDGKAGQLGSENLKGELTDSCRTA